MTSYMPKILEIFIYAQNYGELSDRRYPQAILVALGVKKNTRFFHGKNRKTHEKARDFEKVNLMNSP